jgi:hypothetical protein
MKPDNFDLWLLTFADNLKAFAQPEGGFSRKHPVHGPSGVVSEKAIEQIVYASIGKLKSYRSAILRLITDRVDEVQEEIGKIEKTLTTWLWIFQHRKFRENKQTAKALWAKYWALKSLGGDIMAITGDSTRVALEDLKIAKGIQD